jgi:hypothetical protein
MFGEDGSTPEGGHNFGHSEQGVVEQDEEDATAETRSR